MIALSHRWRAEPLGESDGEDDEKAAAIRQYGGLRRPQGAAIRHGHLDEAYALPMDQIARARKADLEEWPRLGVPPALPLRSHRKWEGAGDGAE